MRDECRPGQRHRHQGSPRAGSCRIVAGFALMVTVAALSADPAAAAPARQTDSPEPVASCLLGAWVHAHEEDAAGIDVFRPSAFPLPPSRGRIGFELLADGTLMYRAIAPADGGLELAGSWWLTVPDSISMALPEGIDTRRIVSCEPGRLVLTEGP